jgi:hypothetical protein
MLKMLAAIAVAAAATLAAAMPALADPPATTTSVLRLGPFVDTDTCSFSITTTVDRIRVDTTFSNGDVNRHVELSVVQTANGHIAIEDDHFNVFIDHTDPSNWKINGRFGQITLDGRLIYLQSGLLSFDAQTGLITDQQPGPLGAMPDACAVLAP